jgi:hypothetical protein
MKPSPLKVAAPKLEWLRSGQIEGTRDAGTPGNFTTNQQLAREEPHEAYRAPQMYPTGPQRAAPIKSTGVRAH